MSFKLTKYVPIALTLLTQAIINGMHVNVKLSEYNITQLVRSCQKLSGNSILPALQEIIVSTPNGNFVEKADHHLIASKITNNLKT